MKNDRVKLAYLVSHPIQYQAPLLRRIAQEPDIDLKVYYSSDFSVRGYRDEGFGIDVQWDVPLLDGYEHEFLPRLQKDGRIGVFKPVNYGILRRLRQEQPDALWVHGYASLNSIHGIMAAKALGVPVLIRSDSSPLDRPRSRTKLFAKQLFFYGLQPFIRGVLSAGNLNSLYWKQSLGPDVPQFFMPYAVDNDYFQRRSISATLSRNNLKAELGLDPQRPIILFASKLIQRKCCSDLLEAYIQLSSRSGEEPKPYLLIVGDGEERSSLEARAQQVGFSSIRFLGFRNQSELPHYFDLCDVFVLPSIHEPWGLVINEVMNASRAVIVSDQVGCQPDLIRDGIEGCVFPARNIPALTRALQRVFATPNTATEMGKRALERIQGWGFEQNIAGLRQALATVTGKISA